MKKFPMALCRVVTVLFAAAPVSPALLRTDVNMQAKRDAGLARTRSLLSSGVRPETVARLMAEIEDEWKSQAALLAKCERDMKEHRGKCPDVQGVFGKSCSTVAQAVVEGSDGNHDRAQEYMSEVCHESALSGWHQARCNQFKRSIGEAMKGNAVGNHNSFDSLAFCRKFWAEFTLGEKIRLAKYEIEQKKRSAEAKKRSASREKKRSLDAKEHMELKKERDLETTKNAMVDNVNKMRQSTERARRSESKEKEQSLDAKRLMEMNRKKDEAETIVQRNEHTDQLAEAKKLSESREKKRLVDTRTRVGLNTEHELEKTAKAMASNMNKMRQSTTGTIQSEPKEKEQSLDAKWFIEINKKKDGAEAILQKNEQREQAAEVKKLPSESREKKQSLDAKEQMELKREYDSEKAKKWMVGNLNKMKHSMESASRSESQEKEQSLDAKRLTEMHKKRLEADATVQKTEKTDHSAEAKKLSESREKKRSFDAKEQVKLNKEHDLEKAMKWMVDNVNKMRQSTEGPMRSEAQETEQALDAKRSTETSKKASAMEHNVQKKMPNRETSTKTAPATKSLELKQGETLGREYHAESIFAAWYGKQGMEWSSSEGIDVTDLVRKELRAGLKVSPSEKWGDPCPNSPKILVLVVGVPSDLPSRPHPETGVTREPVKQGQEKADAEEAKRSTKLRLRLKSAVQSKEEAQKHKTNY